MKSLQYNEKPTTINNIGADIPDASRHHFNTYTDEQKTERERTKTEKKNKDTRKADFKASLSKASTRFEMIGLIEQYEQINLCIKLKLSEFTSYNDIYAYVLANRTSNNVNAFNKFVRLKRRLNYTRENELAAYFETKKVEKYQHITGIEKTWKTDDNLSNTAINFFSNNVKAIQFGNSLHENERIFNLNELEKGIIELKSLINFDFKRVGFSFGARGKAGSVAHYEDTNKVIAINRNRCGAIVHEIGHALDYQKGMISYNLPSSLVQRYREKIYANPALKVNSRYLLNIKEIFARAFEAYMSTILSNQYLLDGDRSDWPELNESDIAWIESVVKS